MGAPSLGLARAIWGRTKSKRRGRILIWTTVQLCPSPTIGMVGILVNVSLHVGKIFVKQESVVNQYDFDVKAIQKLANHRGIGKSIISWEELRTYLMLSREMWGVHNWARIFLLRFFVLWIRSDRNSWKERANTERSRFNQKKMGVTDYWGTCLMGIFADIVELLR